jgi:ABC-type lipoprotein export system ATPase subunit
MVRCEQLRKLYRTPKGEVRSLDGVSLAVRRGEFVCVRGPSGCGKTTLLLALGGMLRPTSGTLEVAGKDVYQLPPAQRARFRAEQIGFVFQMFHLVPYLNLLDNVLLAARPGAGREVAERGAKLLDQLGLAPHAGRTPAELSAGERQRAAVARALLNRPQLILADEPTGNLDPANAREVFQHLKAFQQSGGTVMVVTHGASAEPFADRIIEMSAGKLVEPVTRPETLP